MSCIRPNPRSRSPPPRPSEASAPSASASAVPDVTPTTVTFCLIPASPCLSVDTLPRTDTWPPPVRRHFVARNAFFDPSSPADCPVPVQWLSKGRATWQGKRRHDDRWRVDFPPTPEVPQPLRLGRLFPVFSPSKKAREAFFRASDGLDSYIGAEQKRRKPDLDEKTLSLSDRLSFREAKRKELASFFQSVVWDFDLETSATLGAHAQGAFGPNTLIGHPGRRLG